MMDYRMEMGRKVTGIAFDRTEILRVLGEDLPGTFLQMETSDGDMQESEDVKELKTYGNEIKFTKDIL